VASRLVIPAAKTPKVAISDARWFSEGKKSREIAGAKKPQSAKSYHSRTFPTVPPATVLGVWLVPAYGRVLDSLREGTVRESEAIPAMVPPGRRETFSRAVGTDFMETSKQDRSARPARIPGGAESR
jgi:hypothetical protein